MYRDSKDTHLYEMWKFRMKAIGYLLINISNNLELGALFLNSEISTYSKDEMRVLIFMFIEFPGLT